jgi:phage major head subunit gpT-like protein
MAGIDFTPPVAQRLNVQLITCFDLGVKDGINVVWEGTNGSSTRPLPSVYETVYTAKSETAENVYTYASSDYSLFDTDGDETPVEGVKMYQQSIINGAYKKRSVRVPLIAVKDDRVNQYKTQFHTLGTASVVAPYRRLVKTMQTADTIISTIDDVAFFSGSHPVVPKTSGGATWANDYVRPGGLTFATFAEMWGLMCQFPGEDGYPVGSKPTKLLVGTLDFAAAMDIAYVDKPSSLQGGGNRWYGLIEVVYVPEWTDGTWMLIDDRSSIERAFIFQEREPVIMRPLYTNPEEPWVIEHDALEWRLQGRFEIGVGHPRRALRCRRA